MLVPASLNSSAAGQTAAGSSLKERVLKAGGWSLAGYALTQAIRFGGNLLMTRLLLPEMFGVMAIASMVMYGLALFSDVGLRQSVVQNTHGHTQKFLNAAWVLQIVRGVLIAAAAAAAALVLQIMNNHGWFAADSAYAEPALPFVMFALAITAIIAGFESTKLLEASRHLQLDRTVQIEVLSQSGALLAMLAWVTFDRSIWALIAGAVCSAVLRTLLSHVWLAGTANRWDWNPNAVRELLRFGKWVALSSILGFLVNSGDRLLLGGMIDATSLGIYVIAYLIFSSVEQVLNKIIGDVAFPALSEIARERASDLRAGYYRFHTLIAAGAYAAAGFLAAAGDTLISILYDHRYAGAGQMLQVLAVGLIAVPFRLAPHCLMAMGMPRPLSNIIAVRLVALFLMTPAGFALYGLNGALWGVTVSNLFTVFPILFYQRRFNLLDTRKEIMLLPLLFAALLAGTILKTLSGR